MMASNESHTDEASKGLMGPAYDTEMSVPASMSGALPSSACKTPLHSPLFGGIFGGALNYDLEDKRAEPLRI